MPKGPVPPKQPQNVVPTHPGGHAGSGGVNSIWCPAMLSEVVPPPDDSASADPPTLISAAPLPARSAASGAPSGVPAACGLKITGWANAWFGVANANMDVVKIAAMAEAIIIDAFLCIIIVDNGLHYLYYQ
jgi:hypothetical protein